MILFKIAKIIDAGNITNIQTSAFQRDVEACGDGPPGFNSVKQVTQDIKKYNYYTIFNGEEIIGGFYFRKEAKKCELIRIFINPLYHNKGIGSKTLKFIEDMKDINTIELEASDFNISNQQFYRNRGYSEIGKHIYSENEYSVIFKKELNKTLS